MTLTVSMIGDRLLIGTGVGQLLVYDTKEPLCKCYLYWVAYILLIQHAIVADDNQVPEVTLVQTIKQFSKKPIEQLDIIKEIDVLVSLSGNLHLHFSVHEPFLLLTTTS